MRKARIERKIKETVIAVEVNLDGAGVFPVSTAPGFSTILAFAQNAGITLHIDALDIENAHHMAESCFKGLARALRSAITVNEEMAGKIPSTKGQLGGFRSGC